MKLKSVILGCGERANEHARAYDGLEEIDLVAGCDFNIKTLEKFGHRFNLSCLYEDLDEMLEKQRPDILHIVTPPNVREKPIQSAADFGVKGVIVEKPLALNPYQARLIKDIVRCTGIKVAVNMQRRYFTTCQDLKKLLDEGQIGKIQIIRAVTKGNILTMGPHVVDLLLFFLNNLAPIDVWASAYGMNGYDHGHPAPANMLIKYTYPGGLVTYFEDAENAVGTIGEEEFWQHLELDFWGTKGRAWWQQNQTWGYHCEGMIKPHVEESNWDKSNIPGQREFTRAMAHWIHDDSKIHVNCIDTALKGLDMVWGSLQSVNLGRHISLPADVPEDIIRILEARIQVKD